MQITRRQTNNPRQGAALVLAALMCLVAIPMVGLAIDGATTYMMRAQLSRALDAAVLAGARSLNVGLDVASQAASAAGVAQKYFDANLPTGKFGASNITRSVSVGQDDATHYRWVTVTGSVDVSLTFMSILRIPTAHIGLSATAKRRDVNVMLVLDNSGSMALGNAMTPMIADASDFVNLFAGGRDRLGLVQFNATSYLAYPPSVDFKSGSPNLTGRISQLIGNGATNSSQGIWMAYQELKKLNQPGALNVIVLFTDGLANTFTGDFSTLISPAAGCTGLTQPLVGVLYTLGINQGIGGLSDPIARKLNDTSDDRSALSGGGCTVAFPTSGIASYLTGLPATDTNGNSTDGTGTISAYASVNVNQVTPKNVTNAGLNLLDDAANRIRSDATLSPLIYAIGLGDNPGMPPDRVLMARVANDPTSPFYNKKQRAGLFVFAPSTAQLHSAFLRIASEVLRLSQ